MPLYYCQSLRTERAFMLLHEPSEHVFMLFQESFALLAKYDLGLSGDERDKVDSLRGTWQKVLSKSVQVQNTLSKVQPFFR